VLLGERRLSILLLGIVQRGLIVYLSIVRESYIEYLKEKMSDDSDDDIPIALLMKKKLEAEKLAKSSSRANNHQSSSNGSDKKRKNNNDDDKNEKKKPKLDKNDKKDKKDDKKDKKDKKAVPKKEEKREVKKESRNDKSSDDKKDSQPKKDSSSKTKKESKPAAKDKKAGSSGRDFFVEETIFGLERMDKHHLVSAILRRWKYCLDNWPGEIKAQAPSGFIEGHVPGLFVGVANKVLGELKDLRPFEPKKTPSMESLLTYTATELKDILIKGINAQVALLGALPEDERLKKQLRRELEKAEKLKVKKIERKYQEAKDVLGKSTKKMFTEAPSQPAAASKEE